jgi:hypothetical protein
MKITPGQNQGTVVDPPSSPANQVKTERVSTTAPTNSPAEKAAATAGTSPVQPFERPTDVTLKRDINGRVYYSVADAKSGQEILEVPPKALRDVGQGIEEYVKELQSKATTHVEEKA